MSKEDVEKYGILPHIKTVKAQNVLDWSHSIVGGKSILSRLSIHDYMEDENGEDYQQITLYELIDGKCKVSYYKKQRKDIEFVLSSEIFIIGGNGSALPYIPVVCIGSKNNSWTPDTPPMQGICNIARAQYNNSAAYEDSVYYVGQVQPWMSGLTEDHVKQMKAAGMYIGSRELLSVPSGESFGMEQAGPNSMAKEAISDKTDMAIGLGAMFIKEGTAPKTASQYNGEQAVSHSVLSLVSVNISAAYKLALQIACNFINVSIDKVNVELNQDFTRKQADAQMVTALLTAFQGNAIRRKDMLRYFQNTEIISTEDDIEEVENELRNSDTKPINLDLGE